MANPDQPDALGEVSALIDGEHWTEALRALGPLRRSDPSNPLVWRAQALALRGAGELQEAQFATDQWLSLDDRADDAIRLKIELLDARGKHYAAVEACEELTARDPSDADAFFRLARSQRAAGLVSRARTAVERSLQLDPLRWQTHELAGTIEMAAARPGEAAPHFRDALRLDPDNGQLALDLQRALEAEGSRSSTARSTDSRRKKETRQRARALHTDDKAAAKQRRKAERQLQRHPSTDGSGSPTPRWRRARAAIAVLVVVALLVYLGYRSIR